MALLYLFHATGGIRTYDLSNTDFTATDFTLTDLTTTSYTSRINIIHSIYVGNCLIHIYISNSAPALRALADL